MRLKLLYEDFWQPISNHPGQLGKLDKRAKKNDKSFLVHPEDRKRWLKWFGGKNIKEDLDTSVIYGYRTLQYGKSVAEIMRQHKLVAEGQESYWSPKPIFYYHGTESIDGHNISNITECEFNINDPNLGGFGDSQPFYEWIIGGEDPTQGKLPPQLYSKILQLRQDIIKDPKHSEDWSFAGILPKHHRQIAVQLYKEARQYLKFAELVRNNDEFNYIGPFIDYITAIYVVKPKKQTSKFQYDSSAFDVIDSFVKAGHKLKLFDK